MQQKNERQECYVQITLAIVFVMCGVSLALSGSLLKSDSWLVGIPFLVTGLVWLVNAALKLRKISDDE